MEKNQKISLVLCIFVFVMALVGSILCFAEIIWVPTKPIEHGIKFLKFFTVQSNILGGATAFLYVVFLLRENKTKKPIPLWLFVLRFIATVDLSITFLVVALFLGFITDEGYFSMFVNANLFFHFLVPVSNFVSFVFFEKAQKISFKFTFVGTTHLVLYSIFYLVVVLTHFKDGKVPLYYDWYAFAQLGLPLAFLCAIIVAGLGFLVSFLLYKISNKKNLPSAKSLTKPKFKKIS